MEEIRSIQAQFKAMEGDRQRDSEVDDTSDEGGEAKEEATAPVQENTEMRLLRSVLGSTSNLKLEISTYDGSFIVDNLID